MWVTETSYNQHQMQLMSKMMRSSSKFSRSERCLIASNSFQSHNTKNLDITDRCSIAFFTSATLKTRPPVLDNFFQLSKTSLSYLAPSSSFFGVHEEFNTFCSDEIRSTVY